MLCGKNNGYWPRPRRNEKTQTICFKKHNKVSIKEIKNALLNNKFEELWLKQEPFIFHFGVRDLETAKKMLKIKTDSGIRRGGIFYIKDNKYLIELVGSQYLSLPIKINENQILDDKQLAIMIAKANKKLEKNYIDLKNFCKAILKI